MQLVQRGYRCVMVESCGRCGCKTWQAIGGGSLNAENSFDDAVVQLRCLWKLSKVYAKEDSSGSPVQFMLLLLSLAGEED